jgi:hypothetical protein
VGSLFNLVVDYSWGLGRLGVLCVGGGDEMNE